MTTPRTWARSAIDDLDEHDPTTHVSFYNVQTRVILCLNLVLVS